MSRVVRVVYSPVEDSVCMFERKEDSLQHLLPRPNCSSPVAGGGSSNCGGGGGKSLGRERKYCKFHLGTGRVGACMRRRRLT